MKLLLVALISAVISMSSAFAQEWKIFEPSAKDREKTCPMKWWITEKSIDYSAPLGSEWLPPLNSERSQRLIGFAGMKWKSLGNRRVPIGEELPLRYWNGTYMVMSFPLSCGAIQPQFPAKSGFHMGRYENETDRYHIIALKYGSAGGQWNQPTDGWIYVDFKIQQ